jgi:hypothetical protein
VVARALQIATIGLAPRPRDFHRLLELLKELLVETGERLSAPGAEAYLHSLKVAGKTAQLTRDLLEVAGDPNASSRSSATVRALVGRMRRAERWSSTTGVDFS